MNPSAPCVLGLHSLLLPLECFAVRMMEFNDDQNILTDGSMLWPEVVICSSEKQAERLRDFFNDESFKEDWGTWSIEEPELTIQDAKKRWLAQDFAIYIVEKVESLKNYEHIYRISQSLTACAELFENRLQYK